jgi:hypothetical protein
MSIFQERYLPHDHLCDLPGQFQPRQEAKEEACIDRPSDEDLAQWDQDRQETCVNCTMGDDDCPGEDRWIEVPAFTAAGAEHAMTGQWPEAKPERSLLERGLIHEADEREDAVLDMTAPACADCDASIADCPGVGNCAAVSGGGSEWEESMGGGDAVNAFRASGSPCG